MTVFEEVSKDFLRILKETDSMVAVVVQLQSMKKDKQPVINMINYVYDLVEQYNLFPDTANLKEEKCDAKSEEFREEGNAFFKYFKYVEAVKLYNRSMSYATSKDNLSIALANRSAAFLKMEMFSECLDSIRLAREVGLPERLTVKLAEREAKCKEELKKTPKEAVFVPKIGLPINEKIPFLAKCLELRENKIFGRHIVAKEDIPAGTIIALEESYCKIVGDPDKYMRCATCMAEVPHRLFPCEGCTQTMFCSKKCKEKASSEFHAIECEVAGPLFGLFNDFYRLIIRMVICAFLAFPDIDTMGPALERIEREKKTIFDFDWTKKLSPEELYTPIHNLIADEDLGDSVKPVKLIHYLATGVIFHFLKQSCSTFNQRFLTTKKAEDLLKKIINKHGLTVPINAHALDSTQVLKNPTKRNLGGAIFGFRGLLNHSCLQMISAVSVGNASAIVTVRNIAAGEQVYANYDIHHKSMDRATRRRDLMKKHSFHCECVACIKDYPLLHNYPWPQNVPPLPRHPCETTDNLHRLPLKKAEEGFQIARDYIHKFGHLYPTLQLADAEVQLKFSLNIMCGNISLNDREESHVEARLKP